MRISEILTFHCKKREGKKKNNFGSVHCKMRIKMLVSCKNENCEGKKNRVIYFWLYGDEK